MMHIDQTALCQDRCRHKDRHEASKTGICQRTQSRRNYPRNKASPVASDRDGPRIAARQEATSRSARATIVHAAPPSQWDVGRATPAVSFPARSSCLVYIKPADHPGLPKAHEHAQSQVHQSPLRMTLAGAYHGSGESRVFQLKSGILFRSPIFQIISRSNQST